VEFNNDAAVDAALKQNDWEMDGRPLHIQRAGGGGGGDGGRPKFQRM